MPAGDTRVVDKSEREGGDMSTDWDRRQEDRKWREDMLVQMTRLASHQEHLKEHITEHFQAAEKKHVECKTEIHAKVGRVEKTLFGDNGHAPGLVEKTRFIALKWAALVGAGAFVVTLVAEHFVKKLLAP